MNIDIVRAILNIFAEVRNAHRCLGLDGLVTYSQLVVALRMQPVRAAEKDAIEAAWERWSELFLRPGLPPSLVIDPVLEPTWLDNDPEWLRAKQPITVTVAKSKRKVG